MKHLLNNISEEEKNSILEQHGGGMKIFNENFHKMVNKKLGHVDLYEQTEKTPSTSTENTRKLSDINPNIFVNSNDVEREARTIVDGDKYKIKYGIAALKLFQMVSNKIYELNIIKDKENSTTQVLYMGDKNNPSGERFKTLVGGDNYTIDPGRAAKEQLGAAKYTYRDLKEFWGKDDQEMARLYNTWLDTKI